MNGVSIVEAIRTPFGRFGGKLRQHSAVDLGALVVRAALDRAGLQAQEVGETIFGTALLAASTMVAARQVNFKASIPASTPSLTIDRACCSSMTCIGLASMKIRLGEASMILAGGLDSSSQTPFLMRDARWGKRLGDFTVEDPMQMRNPINQKAIALVTGEMAVKWGVSRDEQDDWATGVCIVTRSCLSRSRMGGRRRHLRSTNPPGGISRGNGFDRYRPSTTARRSLRETRPD